jgi:hypothetical protein
MQTLEVDIKLATKEVDIYARTQGTKDVISCSKQSLARSPRVR